MTRLDLLGCLRVLRGAVLDVLGLVEDGHGELMFEVAIEIAAEQGV